MDIELPGPGAVFDLFQALTLEQKGDFLRRLAQISSEDLPLYIIAHLPKSADIGLSRRLFGVLANAMLPLVIDHAWELLRDHPEITRERFGEEIATLVKELVVKLAEQERGNLKAQRDRKSDPETIRRNVEICDLREEDKKKWTQGRLAKKYDLTPQAIRKILSNEAKWRRLISQ
jgi:hypothetical protein